MKPLFSQNVQILQEKFRARIAEKVDIFLENFS